MAQVPDWVSGVPFKIVLKFVFIDTGSNLLAPGIV